MALLRNTNVSHVYSPSDRIKIQVCVHAFLTISIISCSLSLVFIWRYPYLHFDLDLCLSFHVIPCASDKVWIVAHLASARLVSGEMARGMNISARCRNHMVSTIRVFRMMTLGHCLLRQDFHQGWLPSLVSSVCHLIKTRCARRCEHSGSKFGLLAAAIPLVWYNWMRVRSV